MICGVNDHDDPWMLYTKVMFFLAYLIFKVASTAALYSTLDPMSNMFKFTLLIFQS